MNKQYYLTHNQTVYSFKLPNGLPVYLLPRKGFSGYCGALAVNFGSLNSNDQIHMKNEKIQMERGIAHFIEHRIFDSDRGQVFDLFSKLDASSNAYTSYEKTVYYFAGTSHLKENLELLLHFTQNFHLQPNTVSKEQSIIIEELKMYDDYPDFILHKGILNNLYYHHEVKFDVGGSIDSVRRIDASKLQLAHAAYYRPNNMFLAISGDFDSQEIHDFIVKLQPKMPSKKINVLYPDGHEPVTVVRKMDFVELPISASKCCLGIKLTPFTSTLSYKLKTRKALLIHIILQLLFSNSSALYQQLIRDNIIASDLGTVFSYGKGYTHILVYSDILNEQGFMTKIREALLHFSFDRINFDSLIKQMIGQHIRECENPINLALEYIDNRAEGIDIFEEIDILKSLDFNELTNIRQEICAADYSFFIIRKEGN